MFLTLMHHSNMEMKLGTAAMWMERIMLAMASQEEIIHVHVLEMEVVQ